MSRSNVSNCRKTNWVYPHHISSDVVEKSGEVILVESIGDCLALHEAGFKNVLVTFGLDASSKLISYLNSFELNRIIIATNNDKDKEVNSGGIASVKVAAKLAQVFDLIYLIKERLITPHQNYDTLTVLTKFYLWLC